MRARFVLIIAFCVLSESLERQKELSKPSHLFGFLNLSSLGLQESQSLLQLSQANPRVDWADCYLRPQG